MNELVTLARWQFGITSVYHFLFVPLTLGLSIIVAVMETLYVKRGNEIYKSMTKFWGKLFLINFALGVVTGIVQEFHFGMAWSGFSRFVGDVLGAPLAIEALAAFFIESTFLGLWVFGWEKLSKKIHLVCIWLVAIAGNLSAFWILVVNSFMQQPTGYKLVDGKAVMTSFAALVTNPHLWLQFPHTVSSGLVTAAMFVIGISAYHLLKKTYQIEYFRKSFIIAAVTGMIGLVLVAGTGHLQGQHLVKTQPMKMAAAEALWESADPAPFSIISVIDEKNRKNAFEIAVPGVLSFMSYNRFDGKVEGINELQARYEKEYGPGNYIPPVNIAFFSFRIMIGVGFLLMAVVALALFLYKKGWLENTGWYLKVLILMIPLPYVSNSVGWLLAEMGRQPWVVYGLLKIDDGVSKSVPPSFMIISLVVFLMIYGILAAIDIFLLAKFARKGPEENAQFIEKKAGDKGVSLWT